MKKIFVIILSLLICSGLAACGGSESSGSEESEKETSNTAIDVDKNLLTVDITLPASMFEEEDMTAFDTDAYVQENGFNKAVINPDGSVTVTMTKGKHKELLAEMQATTEEGFQELINGADTPYIKNITHDNDFKTITVEVDRAGYDNAMLDMTPFMVGFTANFYQVFTGNDLHSEVVMKYQDTGEVISTTIYPDAIQDAGSEE